MEEWRTAIDTLKRAYAAWDESKGASLDTWLGFFAAETKLRSLAAGRPGLSFSEKRMSHDGVREYLGGLTATFAMIHYAIDRYVCEGDTIVAIGSTSWRHRQTGKVFDTPKVDVWRVKDGQATAFYEYYDTFMLHETTLP